MGKYVHVGGNRFLAILPSFFPNFLLTCKDLSVTSNFIHTHTGEDLPTPFLVP